MPGSRTTTPWRVALAIGLVGGVAATLVPLAGGPRVPALPVPRPDVPLAATVDGEPIPRAAVDELAARLASELGAAAAPGSEADARILDRLIDEELLFQHGRRLGLDRADHVTRKRIVAVTVDAIVRAAELDAPGGAELERCFEEHRARFARTARVRVEQLLVRPRGEGETARREARERAARVVAALRAGTAPAALPAGLVDPVALPLPDAALGRRELAERVGASAAEVAFELAPGEVSDPVELPEGFRILVLRERSGAEPPALEEVEAEARAFCRRIAGEVALERTLAELRAAARIDRGAP